MCAILEILSFTAKASYTCSPTKKNMININVKGISPCLNSVKEESTIEDASLPGFIKDIVLPINKEQGNSIPVSTFIKYGVQDGSFMSGTAAYEKRGIASFVPTWLEEKCIQCNQCSYVCPHAVIRPFLLNEQEKNNINYRCF